RAASRRGGPVLSSVTRLVAAASATGRASCRCRKAASRKDNPPEPRSGNRNHSTSDHLLSFVEHALMMGSPSPNDKGADENRGTGENSPTASTVVGHCGRGG